MAIRSDITIDWSLSPRIITVASPSITCVMQDLLDTLRFLEADNIGITRPPIVAASGGEVLDTVGTKVGLTVSLLNAVIGFEERLDWTQASLSGGNLVAFATDNITVIEPINPTAFVNITKTSSASATLQEQDALQYSSYGGQVTINMSSKNTGVVFPVGSMEFPVNNVSDAVTIANTRGFSVIGIEGTVVLDTGDDLSDKTIQGSNPITSVLVVNAGSNTNNLYVRDLYFTGALDGGSILRDCVLGEVKYFDGFIEHCAFTSNTIFINGTAVFLNCSAGATCTSPPVIDFTDSVETVVRNYSGNLKIVNKANDSVCQIDINGELIIDSTVIGGVLDIYGDGRAINNATGSFILNDFTTGTPTEIANKVWNTQL